jgi:anti-anti-sigma factor
MQLLLPPPRPGPDADDPIVVHFGGGDVPLDENTFDPIRPQLLVFAEEETDAPLVLDFGNVSAVTGLTLGTLVTLHKKLRAAGRRLSLINLGPQVYEVFVVMGLDRYLDLRPAAGTAAPGAGRRQGPPGDILIVDDEPSILALLEAALRRKGYTVWLASHGWQAVALYARLRGQIAVALLDVLMPGTDGPQTLRALQVIDPGIRCCFMTGNLWYYTEEELLRLGAVHVFQKPFALPEVVESLGRLARPPCSRRQERWIDVPATCAAGGHS